MADIPPREAELHQKDSQVDDVAFTVPADSSGQIQKESQKVYDYAVISAPLDLSDPKYSTKDIVDAREEAPPLPPKSEDDIPPSLRCVQTQPKEEQIFEDAGSLLMKYNGNEGEQDKEVTIDEILRKEEEQGADSESVKAFFSKCDMVDARTEKATPPPFEYNMKNKKRGCFLIFNQKHFLPYLGMTTRTGTNVDASNLRRTAKKLGFEYVRVFDDLDEKYILKWIDAIAAADHSDYDCFACAILTHGEEGDILYAHDGTFSVSRLTEPFEAQHCPSLAGKPKLFFIQACRGQKLDKGAQIGDVVDAKQIAYERNYNIIPNTSDFLLAYSTVQGYYAWRNQSSGSWFVQALCKCLQEYGDHLELMQVMTRVNRMVAYDFISYSSTNRDFHGKKQIPSIVTRLTHELFFKKKEPKHNGEKKVFENHSKMSSKTSDARDSLPGPGSTTKIKPLQETHL